MKKLFAIFLVIFVVVAANLASAMCIDGYTQCGYLNNSPGQDRCCRLGCCGPNRDRCCEDEGGRQPPTPPQPITPTPRPTTPGPSGQTSPGSGLAKELEGLRQGAIKAQPLAASLAATDAKLKKNKQSIEALNERIESLKPSDEFDINSSKILDNEIRNNRNRIAKLEKAIRENEEKSPRLRDPVAIGEMKNRLKKLHQENDDLDWAKYEPDKAREWADKKLKNLADLKKDFLRQKKELELKVRLGEIELAPHLKEMRDRCQNLAHTAINDYDLASKCGAFFSGNQSNRSYIEDRFGVTPIIMPPSRYQEGFERGDWGNVPPLGPGHAVFPDQE